MTDRLSPLLLFIWIRHWLTWLSLLTTEYSAVSTQSSVAIPERLGAIPSNLPQRFEFSDADW